MTAMNRKAGGFTLIEVMFAMMIFAIAMVSLAGFYLGSARLGEGGRNLTQATNDARVVMEAIRNASAAGLATVTATNWTNWAAANGLQSLPAEAITVTYANPAADPLSVTVQVSWVERSRPRTATLSTLVTRR